MSGAAGRSVCARRASWVVGAGGLGSPAAFYLAAAGLGRLGIVDGDTVDLSNLQRQILHTTADRGHRKVESARSRLAELSTRRWTWRSTTCALTDGNAAELMEPYDFIIDGSDNFDTKFLVNDVAVSLGKPFSHAGNRPPPRTDHDGGAAGERLLPLPVPRNRRRRARSSAASRPASSARWREPSGPSRRRRPSSTSSASRSTCW